MQRTSRLRSLTVPKSDGAVEALDIADDSSKLLQDGALGNDSQVIRENPGSLRQDSQAFRENTRRERSTNASMSARESVLQALAEQKVLHQKETSEIVQAIAASSEQRMAHAVALNQEAVERIA